MKRTCAALAFAAVSASSSAFAITNISPTDLSAFSQDSVTSLVQTVGVVADHHAYMPATPLGILLGVDIGLDVTYLALPSSFATALALASGQSTTQLPTGLVLPKLNIHKGLPLGIDVGASFMSVANAGQTVFSSYGGDVKWAFLNKPVIPVVAVRGSYSSNNVYFLTAHTFTLDVVASKSLILLDPYVGAGMQFWSGSITVPVGIPQLPASVSASASGSNPHVYAGVMLKLLVLKVVAQADYSGAGFTTFGGKFSFGF